MHPDPATRCTLAELARLILAHEKDFPPPFERAESSTSTLRASRHPEPGPQIGGGGGNELRQAVGVPRSTTSAQSGATTTVALNAKVAPTPQAGGASKDTSDTNSTHVEDVDFGELEYGFGLEDSSFGTEGAGFVGDESLEPDYTGDLGETDSLGEFDDGTDL